MSEAPELIFEEPPKRTGAGRKSPITPWLHSLREHPGQWARYPTEVQASKPAERINKGLGYGVKPGEFEATTRRRTAGKLAWLYARYVGDQS